MKYFISAILTVLIVSCSPSSSDNMTYFGGQILNPKSDFVLFLKDDKVIDSVTLDEDNRFMTELESIEEGLYTFKHGVEFQYVYLEPKDSILVRLNTWDFDESLVFTGIGSSKNNFLISLFLQNEKEESKTHQWFKHDEEEFQKRIDHLRKRRMEMYNEFANSSEAISEGFAALSNSAINYPLYNLKEIYPYYHRIANRLKSFPEVSQNFYAFRNDVDLNNQGLVAFYPYQNYVVSYLYNLSHHLQEQDSSKDHTTLNVLNAIVEHIELEGFKNTLLKRIVVNDFFKSASTCNFDEEVLSLFLENCSNESAIAQVKNLVHDSQQITTNEPMSDFEVVSFDNEVVSVSEVISDQPAVIYFWSTEFLSSQYLVKRIQYLERKFPHILFVGINLHESDDVRNEPNLKKLNINKQFRLTKTSDAHNFLTSNYPRTIILNKDLIVKNGFTYLDSKMLTGELKKVEKH